jgi:hypothetical protein
MSPLLELSDHESVEKKLGDIILARWETVDLPDDAVVTHITFFPFRGERIPLPWKDGRLSLPEGEVHPGETPAQAIDRIGLELAGITGLTATHLGHLRCRATSFHPTQALNTVTYRALYGVDVTDLADSPTRPGYERHMCRERELMSIIRDRYFELDREYSEALDKFYVERLKQQAATGA